MSVARVYLRQGLYLLGGLLLIVGLSALVVRACQDSAAAVTEPLGRSAEERLHDLVLAQLALDPDYQIIENPALERELAAMVGALGERSGADWPWPIRVRVVKNGEANAITLPGGEILVFSGLLRDAASAEEVAGVLAHELGHVHYGDVMEAVSRNLAIAVLVSLGSGSASPEAVQQLASLLTQQAFSRGAEERADRYALDLMARARIDPGHLADFFESLGSTPLERQAGKALSWISSHPDTKGRIERARSASKAFKGPEEGLGIDWKALQDEL